MTTCRSTVAILLLAAVSAVAHARDRITLVTEEYPPFNMSVDGKVTGISTRIVSTMFERARVPFSIELYPWQRAITMARDLRNTCVFSMSRTPEREESYRWIGPLVENEWALFAVESRAPQPRTLEEARAARIGSYAGDAIVHFLRERDFTVDVAPADVNNPRKLQRGRIDYWATGKLIGQNILRQEGIQGIVPVLVFNKTRMFLACHRQLPDAIADQLTRQLAAMEKDGSIDRAFAEFGYSR